MKLLEYKAQELFRKYAVPTMKSAVIEDAAHASEEIAQAELTYPVVIKAQVPIGGRGKAGGVKFADTPQEADQAASQILGMDLRGYRVEQLMAVEKANPGKEWYLSILLDRLSKSPMLIFSPMGGMDIEEVAKTSPEKIAKVPINPFMGPQSYTIRYALDQTGTDPSYAKALADVVNKLYKLFFDYHTMLVEINPLSVSEDGALTALDGKIEIDDSALYKLPDIVAFRDKLQEDPLVVEARSFGFHLVPLEKEGTIGVMSNGSGMLMSCIDLLSKAGVTCGAALDLGGGATAERIKEAVRIVLSKENIHTVFLCIFGGITRCDEVAGGVRMALEAAPEGKCAVIRMEGTNKEKGQEILAGLDMVVPVGSIPEGVAAIAERQGV